MNINLLVSSQESQVLSLDQLIRKYPKAGDSGLATALNETYSSIHNSNQNISNQIASMQPNPSLLLRQPYKSMQQTIQSLSTQQKESLSCLRSEVSLELESVREEGRKRTVSLEESFSRALSHLNYV